MSLARSKRVNREVPAISILLCVRFFVLEVGLCNASLDDGLPANLYIIRELGSEILAILRVNQDFVTVRLPGDEFPAIAEQVWLELKPERIFLYTTDGALLS